MKSPLPVFLSAWALGVLAPSPERTAVEVAFAPEEGTTLTKTFQTEASFDLEDFSAIVDGQDLGAMLGALEMASDSTTTIAVTDTYGPVAGGRPGRLERRFDTLEGGMALSFAGAMGNEDMDMEMSSELEGLHVVFELHDDGEYVASFADAGDEDLLDGLEEDMDLRFLLPAGSVSEGDTWEVDVAAFAALMKPGGNLALVSDPMEDTEDMDWLGDLLEESLREKLEELLDGTCTCTYVGTREGEGGTLAEIAIELEISSAVDLVDLFTKLVDAVATEQGEDVPFELDVADLNLDVESEGTLLWNLAGGHLDSLELSSDGDIALDVSLSLDSQGEAHEAELSLEIYGSAFHRVAAD